MELVLPRASEAVGDSFGHLQGPTLLARLEILTRSFHEVDLGDLGFLVEGDVGEKTGILALDLRGTRDDLQATQLSQGDLGT